MSSRAAQSALADSESEFARSGPRAQPENASASLAAGGVLGSAARNGSSRSRTTSGAPARSLRISSSRGSIAARPSAVRVSAVCCRLDASARSSSALACVNRDWLRTSTWISAGTPSVGNDLILCSTPRGCWAFCLSVISAINFRFSASSTSPRTVLMVSLRSGKSFSSRSSSALASSYHSAWIRNRPTRSRSS